MRLFEKKRTCTHVKHIQEYADLATGRERQLVTGKRAERTKQDFQFPICRSAILCHWPSQLFDLRAQLSTDVPVLLLNQPNWEKGHWDVSL